MIEVRIVTVSNNNSIYDVEYFINVVECLLYVVKYSLYVSYIYLTSKAIFWRRIQSVPANVQPEILIPRSQQSNNGPYPEPEKFI